MRRFCPGAEIVLVGNGVTSNARHVADTYIPLAGNIGVAGGWNLAALEATRPYLCFLNDDAVFVDDEPPRRLSRRHEPAPSRSVFESGEA
ncbi:MAG: hypothetical protein H0W18_13915, partial [Acidobacteria bacterium]|nr:hypothetical protein [Acidobacteriota bacterium]